MCHGDWVFLCMYYFLTNKYVGMHPRPYETMSRLYSHVLSDKVGYIFPMFLHLLSLSCHNLGMPAHNWVHRYKLWVAYHILFFQKWNHLLVLLHWHRVATFLIASMFEHFCLRLESPKSIVRTNDYESKAHYIFPNLEYSHETLSHISVRKRLFRILAHNFLVLHILDKKDKNSTTVQIPGESRKSKLKFNA